MNFTLLAHNMTEGASSEFSVPVVAYVAPCMLQDHAYDVVRVAWAVVDTDDDGRLSWNEVRAVYDDLYDVTHFFAAVDTNSDSLITWEEALPYYSFAEATVNELDIDGDGVYSPQELSSYFDDAMFSLVDADADGAVTCEDIDILLEAHYGEVGDTCDAEVWTALLWAVADTNGDEGLAFEEVFAFVHDEVFADLFFQAVDEDNSGVCELAEQPYARQYVSLALSVLDANDDSQFSDAELGPYFSEEEFSSADVNQDGVIGCSDLELL